MATKNILLIFDKIELYEYRSYNSSEISDWKDAFWQVQGYYYLQHSGVVPWVDGQQRVSRWQTWDDAQYNVCDKNQRTRRFAKTF